MKKGVIVVVNLFVFLLFLFAFFAQPVNAFSFGKSPPNPGNCVIKSISWDENFIGLGDKSKLIIKGENCNEKTVELNVFEKDFLFDDSVKSFEVSFANEVISVELDSSDLNYLFDEVFEGDGLEIYFEIGFDSRKEVSSVLTVSEDGVGLAPFEGGVDLEVINAPINLVATAQSATSVLLNWVDNSRNEDGFTLQYKLSSAPEGDWVDVPGASNLVTENSLGTGGTVEYLQTTGLTAGTSYDYRVNAHDNKGGVSLWSDAASTRTLDLTPQITSISPNPVTVGSAPVDITISGSGFVSEFVIVNKVAGAREWTSYCSYIDTQRCVFDVTSNTIRVQLYAAPQTVPGNYEFAVVNVHDPNNLIYSNPFGLVIQAQSTVLNAPLNLVATAQSSTTSSSMLLSWVDNSNNEDGFTLQYKLNTAPETAWANVPGASNLTSGNGVTMTYTHTGLTARNLYDYRVRAYVNSGNPSAWITVSGVRALDFVPQITSMSPSPVTIGSAPVTVTISGSNFVSEFSVGMRPQGSTEPWINNIYCSYVPNTGCNFVNSNTITIPIPANAAPGNYEFMVANVYNIAVPIISDPNVLTIQTQATIPNVPSGLTAVAQSSTSMLLTWTDNSLNEQGFTLQYKLNTAPESSWANVPGASNLPAGNVPGGTVTYSQTTGLVANTAYNYRVRAYNGEGPSAWYPTGVPYPTGTTFVCDNGQTRLCSEQRGVCNLASETCTGNVWPGCTATVYQSNAQTRYGVNYQVGSETLCDGRDNNCNNLIDDIAMLSAPFCSNQEGVCAGSKKSCGGVSGWSECTGVQYTANSVNYRATEVGVCRDGLDNDCDIEFDYDGAGSIKGDSDCAVSVTSINAPEQVFISSNFNLDCVSSVPNIRSVIGSLDGVSCSFVNWIESIARFDCTSSSTPRVQVAACDIDITKSYNNGGLISSDVNVVSNACNSYSTSESCEAVSGNIFDWVLGCSGKRSNGFGDRCVPTGTGTGSYMCRVNSCGATCDGTVNGCSSSSICDLNSCGCVEQNPSINVNGVSPGIFAWSSNNIVVTVTGSYFVF